MSQRTGVPNTTKYLAAFLAGICAVPAGLWLVAKWGDSVPHPADATRPSSRSPVLFTPSQRDRDVAKALLSGGYILHFRHGHRQKWDSVIAFDVFELATGTDAAGASFSDAVCLTSQGKEEAKMIGEVYRLAGGPAATIVASPSCRARQTAELAFGRIDAIATALAHTPVVNVDNADDFARELERVYRQTPMPPGGNIVVFGHGNTLENHPQLFESGSELLRSPTLSETGFYVLQREADGERLTLVHEYLDLGKFAAAALDLNPAVERP